MTDVVTLILENLDIVGDLYQCALVNKNFNKAATPLLWDAPAPANSGELLRSLLLYHHHFIQPLSPLGHRIRKLSFRCHDSTTTMMLVLNHTPLLEELDICHMPSVNYQTLHHIALLCPNITELRLRHLSIGDRSMTILSEHYKNLYSLTLDKCDRLSPFALFLARKCPFLCLTLENCAFLSAVLPLRSRRPPDEQLPSRLIPTDVATGQNIQQELMDNEDNWNYGSVIRMVGNRMRRYGEKKGKEPNWHPSRAQIMRMNRFGRKNDSDQDYESDDDIHVDDLVQAVSFDDRLICYFPNLYELNIYDKNITQRDLVRLIQRHMNLSILRVSAHWTIGTVYTVISTLQSSFLSILEVRGSLTPPDALVRSLVRRCRYLRDATLFGRRMVGRKAMLTTDYSDWPIYNKE
ncbi:hypothetical protein BC941DRAFT_436247 [Chlamydoabsidia padenii]|nr:hypothetical protein BC941DRAFT_436247 [Chlamydoabsidia padenii]